MDPAHILVVDDDLRLRDLLKRYLTEQGFATDTVPDSATMERQLQRVRYDLMVLDLMLPGEDGLAICRRLCQLMGGDIWLVANREKGSEFIFMLQLGKTHDAADLGDGLAARSDEGVVETLSKSRVLIAEDNRVNSTLISAMLRKFGVTPRCVENGLLAVEAASDEVVDLIFMDVQMPELDGIAATGAIREYEHKNATPPVYIIALTAEAMQGDNTRCLEAGMNDYLSKPLRSSDLAAALGRYCSRKI